MKEKEIKELINRRRRQVLVHSCIYYRFGTSVVSDKQFDEWAYELRNLQEQYPELAKRCVYAEEFEDFDGTTGYHLPLADENVVSKAHHLIQLHKEEEK